MRMHTYRIVTGWQTKISPQGAMESGHIHNEVIHQHRRTSEHGNVPEHRVCKYRIAEELAE